MPPWERGEVPRKNAVCSVVVEQVSLYSRNGVAAISAARSCHSPYLVAPHVHEFSRLGKHWNCPEKVRPAHPLEQVRIDTLLLALLVEEHRLLMCRVFGTCRNIYLGQESDVWVKQGRVQWIIRLGSVIPFCVPFLWSVLQWLFHPQERTCEWTDVSSSLTSGLLHDLISNHGRIGIKTGVESAFVFGW